MSTPEIAQQPDPSPAVDCTSPPLRGEAVSRVTDFRGTGLFFS